MRPILIAAALALAACGADGPPRPPAAAEAPAQPGLSVTGEVQMGIVVNPRYVEG